MPTLSEIPLALLELCLKKRRLPTFQSEHAKLARKCGRGASTKEIALSTSLATIWTTKFRAMEESLRGWGGGGGADVTCRR
ncbi:hypothetical protein LCL97_11615, partial [Seohaeicola saemankumensis]